MCRMHRVLEVDKKSLIARIQPGVYGPHMEEQLEAEGVTLGHFPDSFVHSTSAAGLPRVRPACRATSTARLRTW